MQILIKPEDVIGLNPREKVMLADLFDIYNAHAPANAEKERYYEGSVSLGEVNLGLAIPDRIRNLSVKCAWGAKAVDVLAARSMFDGYVTESGQAAETIDRIVRDNRLIFEYGKACRDELKYGCTFATLSADVPGSCRIRFHSPTTAAAKWDGARGGIAYGMAVIAMSHLTAGDVWQPRILNLYTDDAVVVIRRNETDVYFAEYLRHQMGRPLMEPMIWNATSAKPLGRSRLKDPIRSMIQGYIRTMANAAIALEFSTAPQKYLLGITDEQYDKLVDKKFQQYVGSILLGTTNPDTGEKPAFGQLPQGTLTPHVEQLRILATQFSAATGLPITDTGVVNNANPTSSDAILAQTQTLVRMAEDLNAGNGSALHTIGLMAQAIAGETTIDRLSDEEKGIMPHFKNPAMPSVAVTADAALKIATARPGFAQTNTFLEMVGFQQADIRRINAQEQRARGLALADEIAAGV